jgi:hypothetical protein
LDHPPFVSSNHPSFQEVLVREGGATAGAVGAAVEAGTAVVVAGVCAGWLVHPVMKTARRSRPIHVRYRTFILNEEFVRKNKHSGLIC